MRRRLSFMLFFLFILFLAAACQPQPSTVVYVVVTPTPTDEAAAPAAPTVSTSTPLPSPTNVPPSPAPLSSTPDAVPTETVAQVQVAEQVFEGGRMFWLQPVAEIWVLVVEEEGTGRWLRFEDTFTEGEDPETDPSINAPEGKMQPERGFGKLWRENPQVREALGWAITPEFGYISEYHYRPGGRVLGGSYISGPGNHVLLSLNSEEFCFHEETGRWELGC